MPAFKTQINWLKVTHFIAIVLILFSLGLVSGRVWGNLFLKPPEIGVTLLGQNEASSGAERKDWLKYQDPQNKFSFDYPPTWELGEEASTSAVLTLTDPRVKPQSSKSLLKLSTLEESLNISSLEQTPFGEEVAFKLKPEVAPQKTKEGVLTERYYFTSQEKTGLLAEIQTQVGSYNYAEVLREILSSITFTMTSEKESKGPSPEVSLSVKQLGDLVQFRARVVALSGGSVEKVRFYVDGSLVYELKARPLGGVPLPNDFNTQAEATKISLEWLRDQLKSEVSSYLFRHHRDWSGVDDSCGIDRGYTHVFLAGSKYYDVRLSEDFGANEKCYEGEGIQVEENWYYLFKNPSAGAHTFSVQAFGAEGGVATAKVEDFQVR